MANISFRPIIRANWRTAYKLRVSPEQEKLLAPNGYSLLQTLYETEYDGKPLGIYADDTMVGFMMTGIMPEETVNARWINRFMIGADYQNKGYGHEALSLYLLKINAEKQYKQVKISYKPHNEIARKLYLSLGFVEVGIHTEWEEMIAVYSI